MPTLLVTSRPPGMAENSILAGYPNQQTDRSYQIIFQKNIARHCPKSIADYNPKGFNRLPPRQSQVLLLRQMHKSKWTTRFPERTDWLSAPRNSNDSLSQNPSVHHISKLVLRNAYHHPAFQETTTCNAHTCSRKKE